MRQTSLAVLLAAAAAVPAQAHEIGVAHDHLVVANTDVTVQFVLALTGLAVCVFALPIAGALRAGGKK